LTRLAIHRDYLTGRNAKVPLELAEAWAALGNFTRAESIGDSLADRGDRVVAQVIRAGRLLAVGERRPPGPIRPRAVAALALTRGLGSVGAAFDERVTGSGRVRRTRRARWRWRHR
jgi:hypothetical protein